MQLGILAIGDPLPAGRVQFLDDGGREELVGGPVGQAVKPGPERLSRPDEIGDVLRGGIDADRLCRARRAQSSSAQRSIPSPPSPYIRARSARALRYNVNRTPR